MMHDHTAETGGDPRIRYWTAGDRGPRVLLVMGFTMRGEVWQAQIEGLSSDHQVAWFDNRGLGESGRGPKRIWTMADMATDALSVLAALGWTSAHLVGVSMGGMIAQEMAIAHPECFESLSLLVTHSGGPLRHKFPPLQGLSAFAWAKLKGPKGGDQAQRQVMYPPAFLSTVDPQAMDDRMALQFGHSPPRATVFAHISAIFGHDTCDRLGQLTLPTLIVGAGSDALVQPKSAARLKAQIPHAELMEIPDSGHGIIFQKSTEVNRAIRRHIAKTKRPR